MKKFTDWVANNPEKISAYATLGVLVVQAVAIVKLNKQNKILRRINNEALEKIIELAYELGTEGHNMPQAELPA